MLKEEQVLFPMLQMGMGPQASTPIQVMRYEHDQHAEALEQLLSLTNQITPPAEACNTWRSLYRELSAFHADLREHIRPGERHIVCPGRAQPRRGPRIAHFHKRSLRRSCSVACALPLS